VNTGAQLKDDVIGELRWDRQISDPEAIGVGAGDGAVIVSGHVPGYAGRMAAAQAAASAPGAASVGSHLVIAP
jgi:osmotically-inducible protein OsmY